MTTLFNRKVSVVVGDLDVSDLDVEFEVKKTLLSKPNTCDLKVYNLAPDSIRRLETFGGNVPCRLLAGHGTETSQLYFGELRAAWTEYDERGTTVTHLTTDTAAKAKKLATIYQPVGAKASAADVLQVLVRALGAHGVHPGTVSKGAAARLAKLSTLHPKPGVLAGNTFQLIDDFCRSADLAWSVQDGVVQILEYEGALDGTAIELSAETGLVESPTVDSKGIVSAKCLIIPDLRPGRKVSMASRFVSGGFVVQSVEYTGSNFGKEFYAEIKGRRY